ncbi:MAG: peptidylprolyl isomerase [Planctomycetota bacterium]|nr:peptidylprolyl isomerase [Planctomycetota bacterium]
MRCFLPSMLAALLLLAPSPVQADPPRHSVPEARPIQLDGAVRTAEWDAAKALAMDEGTEILVQQFRGTLLIALRSDRVWTRRGSLTLFVCPDGPEAGADAPGAARISYEPFEHNREHAIVYRRGAEGWQRLYDSVVVRHALGEAQSTIEMAVPLGVLGLTKDSRPALRVCVQWSRIGAKGFVWPAGLDLRPAAGRRPADLMSAKRWGLLEGWGDPTGPGAFSKTDWDTWTKRDREIRERGTTAHQTVALLVEEWKKTKKRDAELEEQVLGNLRWIRQHERLTPNDLLAMVTTLRYLNRHGEALGMVEALLDHPDVPSAQRAWRERALLLQSMQRYEDAAADWTRLATTTGKPWNAAYARAAETCRKQAAAWAAERKARAAVEKDDKLPRVALHTTHGVIEIVLHANEVPDAAKHFLELVGSKFYDGTLFHRVHGEFLAQGGDPKSRDQGLEHAGSGSSPKLIPIEENAKHDFWRGAVGFARGVSDYNGSQFFLMTGPRPGLGDYTLFGHIVRGQAVADRLAYGDTLIKAVVLKK